MVDKSKFTIPIGDDKQVVAETSVSVRIEDIVTPPPIDPPIEKPTALIEKYWKHARIGVEYYRNVWVPKMLEKQEKTGIKDGIANQLNYDGGYVHWVLGKRLGLETTSIQDMDNWFVPTAMRYKGTVNDRVASGPRNYNRGPCEIALETNSPLYKEAVIRWAMLSSFSRPWDVNRKFWPPEPVLAREISNALFAHLQLERIQDNRESKTFRRQLAVALKGIIEDWLAVLSRRDLSELAEAEWEIAPHMMSLVARSLIAYDGPGAVEVLSQLANAIYPLLWRKDERGEGFLYRPKNTDAGDPIAQAPAKDLALMVFPWYAWLWEQTKKPLYAEIAQKLFALGVDHSWLGIPKHFNLNYYLSGDGVRSMGWD